MEHRAAIPENQMSPPQGASILCRALVFLWSFSFLLYLPLCVPRDRSHHVLIREEMEWTVTLLSTLAVRSTSGVITEMPKAREAAYQNRPCNLEVIQGVFLMDP